MQYSTRSLALLLSLATITPCLAADGPAPDEVLAGLRQFYAATASEDGSFQAGVDRDYAGMSDSAYSDLAPVTYACTVHRTFGWTLPFEEQTVAFLRARQRETGEFFNVGGTVDPAAPEGRVYNTTQGLVALRSLGEEAPHNPFPVFEEILRQDYKTLPAYSTSFFPLAYLCGGRPIPEQADRSIRALMIQDEDGYLNDHVAATFHAAHYYGLVGEPTPKARQMVERTLRDQHADGSWLLNMPARDRHATFDAVMILHHEGAGRDDCRQAIERAARWSLSCRNADGGFGHFPGSTSDADAVYFHVGTLVMAGFLKPADPLPRDAHLLSWGHLLPLRKKSAAHRQFVVPVGQAASLPGDAVTGETTSRVAPPSPALPPRGGEGGLEGRLAACPTGVWIGSLAFSPDRRTLATGSSDGLIRLWDVDSGKVRFTLAGHANAVVAVAFSPDGKQLASASHDHTARVWDLASGEPLHKLGGHRGAVACVAFIPKTSQLATGSLDGTIVHWDAATGGRVKTLTGHKSWVNAIVVNEAAGVLVSGSSDGTIKLWSLESGTALRSLPATKAEVRSLALSPNAQILAAGLRYGQVKLWKMADLLAADGANPAPFRQLPTHAGDVWSVQFTPDGAQLLTVDGDWNRPSLVKSWDAGSGAPAGHFQHTGEILSLSVSPDGQYVAAAGGDGAVSLWGEPRETGGQ